MGIPSGFGFKQLLFSPVANTLVVAEVDLAQRLVKPILALPAVFV
jgi:hypothetical protein